MTKTTLLLAATWVCCAPALVRAEKTLTVSPDGRGDFKTVQEAIAAVPDDSADRTVIHIKPGTYLGQILLPKAKSNVTFEGEDAGTTVLTYALNVKEVPEGPPARFGGTGVVILGNDFHAEKITFQNTSGDHGQALALRIDGDRADLEDCRMLGWQDTLMINNGRQYFKRCFIEGRVDFIYGGATAVFDRCEIRSKNGGYITAASTPQDRPFGFVFFDCRLTGDPTPWIDPATGAAPAARNTKAPMTDLGRPWRPYASVTYVNCSMGDHIKPAGWDNWGNVENEKTARYAEFQCTGPGANPGRRVGWSRQLTNEEAAKLTIPHILGGSDGWKPGARTATAAR